MLTATDIMRYDSVMRRLIGQRAETPNATPARKIPKSGAKNFLAGMTVQSNYCNAKFDKARVREF